MSERRKVIIIRETWPKSWLRDASTWALCMMLILPGWYLDSFALTAIGVVMFWIAVILKSVSTATSLLDNKMTLHEAREEIDRMISEDQS